MVGGGDHGLLFADDDAEAEILAFFTLQLFDFAEAL